MTATEETATDAPPPNPNDVAITVNGRAVTATKGELVIAAAERRIVKAFPAADVLIHPDPYGHAEVHEREFDDAS